MKKCASCLSRYTINPLNAELNPIRHLLALVGARHIVHVSRIRANCEAQSVQHQLQIKTQTYRNVLCMDNRQPYRMPNRLHTQICSNEQIYKNIFCLVLFTSPFS